MLNIVGYNLCGDINSLDPYANNVSNITSTTLTNGIYDHINISKNVTSAYSSVVPTWDFNTILDCDFNENIKLCVKMKTISKMIESPKKGSATN